MDVNISELTWLFNCLNFCAMKYEVDKIDNMTSNRSLHFIEGDETYFGIYCIYYV